MEVRVLGPIEVCVAGSPVDAGASRQRAVLAVLAIEAGRPVSPGVLLERVWGADPPQRVRHSLHVYISRIRQLCAAAGAPAAVVRRSGGYVLDLPPGATDTGRFRDLVARAGVAPADRVRLLGEAIALWRGEPLSGLAGEWAEREREAWQRRYVEAILSWAAAKRQGGDLDGAVEALLRLSADHPYDEAVAAELMHTLAAGGQRARALEHYRTVRARFVDDLGTEPGAALRQVHRELLSEEPLPVPAARRGPALLPSDAWGFTGREPQLARLDEVLAGSAEQPTAVPIGLITGPPGVGKTTLAVHWAHRVAARFPDGQLYVNLRGFDPGGRTTEPVDAVRRFLDALGVPAAGVPQGLEAQAARYRSLISGRRMLVVLDNARDADQVRPLLPGTSSVVVLVTSRNRLTGLVAVDGARPLALDVLSPAESRELLQRRLGAERVPDRVVTLCAGLPLALAIVAARAQESSFAALADELVRGGRQLDSLDAGDSRTEVRAVFSWSYQALTAAGAHLFRLLGLHPGPDFGRRAAESLAGTDVRAGLAELTRASLLVEYRPGRYALHDLLRAYAMELMTSADRPEEAFARLADHYLHSAAAADRLLNPLRRASVLPITAPAHGTSTDDPADPAAWFAVERANLLAVLGRAAETGQGRAAWQLAWAADTALERLGHWHDLVSSWERALRVAPDTAARAYAHRRLAHGFTLLGRDAEAEAQLQEVLRLYEQAGDLTGQAVTHHSLSYMYDTRDDVERALHHSELALACSEQAGDTAELATALNAVGWCHGRLGDHARALTYCRRALALIDPADHRSLGETWDSIGYAHHHLGEYDRAADAYRTAVAMARRAEDRFAEATLLTHLGDTCVAAGDRKAAGAAWRPAIELLAAIDESAAATLRRRLAGLGAQMPQASNS
ncbi:DNA-binding SARP family transcriptional activator/tetratricopeptide (TPR) repeat protein [Actinoplanes tereljensis]|uniref:SARP family transcriptional regulator n=1 Tax=Paractinoplanes tereljensis TaxID=571912 RepID=A0A919TVR5_9ACTN|nr:BTAD domain-containing putative transcriptional regulator [Actinoplanes tereljensis]GIF23614.1 SARP family transcriptional regulator [Actinoplanes tereljensis]